MAIAPKFKVTYADGRTEDITSLPIDVIRWESKNGRTYIAEIPTVEQLAWVAWSAGVRSGQITDDQERRKFENWLPKLADITNKDDDEDENAADPTPADTPTEDSATE